MTTPNKSPLRLALIFCILSTALTLSNFQRLSLAVLGDHVMADTGITMAELALIGAAIFYPYALLQIPSGIAGDKISSRRIIMCSCAVTGIAAMIFSRAGSLASLGSARFLTGAATAFVYVPSLAVIRREFGDARYGTMAGLFMAISGISGICASAPLRVLSEYVDWRTIFMVIGVIELVLVGLAFIVIPDNEGGGAGRPLSAGLRETLSPGMVSIWIWILLTVGTNLAITSLWGGRFYTDSLGMSGREAAVGLMMMSIGNVVGAFISGPLADKLGAIRMVSVSSVINALFLGSLAFVPVGTSSVTVFALSLANGFFNQAACTSGFAAIKYFVKPETNGLASGVSNCWNFIGSALFTQLSGSIMLLIGGTVQEQYRGLFLTFGVLVAFAGLLVAFVNRKIFSKR